MTSLQWIPPIQKLLKETALKAGKTPSGSTKSSSTARVADARSIRHVKGHADAHSHSVRKPHRSRPQRESLPAYCHVRTNLAGRGRHAPRKRRGHHGQEQTRREDRRNPPPGAKRRHTRLSARHYGVSIPRFRKPNSLVNSTRFRQNYDLRNSESSFRRRLLSAWHRPTSLRPESSRRGTSDSRTARRPAAAQLPRQQK